MADSTSSKPTPRSGSIFAPSSGNGNGDQPSTSGSGEGMDRRIQKKLWTPVRIAMAVGAIAFVALIVWGFMSTTGGQRLNVERDKITVGEVTYGPFQEFITQTGNVEPMTTIYLDAVQGGRVEEIFVREGVMVEEGQPLLRLSNNDLQLRLISTDAQRIEQINQLQDMRFRMEQNALSLRQQLADMDYNIERLRNQFGRRQELYEKNLISQEDFEEVKNEYEYYQRSRQLTLAAYEADSLRMAAQIAQMEGTVARMEDNYEIIQDILDNLTVRAPVSGYLTSLVAEIGELRSAGSRFGQIDVLDGFKVNAGVDEFYISRVRPGQRAVTQPIAGREYEMEVIKIYPEVTDGRFQVDLEFTGEAPPNIRRGQTIRFRLEMSDPADAMLVPRGGFYQTTGGNWIFVVTPDGDEAVRRNIRIGRQNPQHFEVLEGLEPGEQVITSSYDTFGDADRLVLN